MADFTPKHHPTEDALELFAMGRLAGHEQAPVEEHLLICESCRRRVEELDQFTGAIRAALPRVEREPVSRSNLWAAILRPGKPALAIVAACAVLMIVIPAVRRPARTAQTVELSALRGTAETNAKSGGPLDLRLPADGLESHASVKVEIVDGAGESQWTGVASLRDRRWHAHVSQSLGSGTYFVRAYAPATSELLREYPLVLQ